MVIPTILVYWTLNIPLSILLAFTLSLGFIGFWLAMFVSLSVMCAVFLLKIGAADWEDCVRAAGQRGKIGDEGGLIE